MTAPLGFAPGVAHLDPTAEQDCRRRYRARLAGLVSDSLASKRVLVAGVGGGSYLAVKLARMGVGALVVADHDRVEWENLCRTAYSVADVGSFKVDSLARHIHEANPWTVVSPHAVDLCAMSEPAVHDLLDGVDLIVAGTDTFEAQAIMNRWSQQAGIPAVFVGLHEGARGGRIVWSVPGETPCYRCVAADRYAAHDERGADATDLPGGVGLLVDVQIVDMLAAKIALAILERGTSSAAGRFFASMGGRTEVIIRTSREYEYGQILWDAVLGDLPDSPKPYAAEIEGLLCAVDSIWMATAQARVSGLRA